MNIKVFFISLDYNSFRNRRQETDWRDCDFETTLVVRVEELWPGKL